MALSLSSEAPLHHVVGWHQWSVFGSWTFREAPWDPGVSRSATGSPIRNGQFRARQVPRSPGYIWRLELEEQANDTGPTSDAASRFSAAGPPAKAVKKSHHRDLMALLGRELQDRYGRAGEFHVLFQQVQPPFLPWRLRQPGRWWRRIWWRLSGS